MGVRGGARGERHDLHWRSSRPRSRPIVRLTIMTERCVRLDDHHPGHVRVDEGPPLGIQTLASRYKVSVENDEAICADGMASEPSSTSTNATIASARIWVVVAAWSTTMRQADRRGHAGHRHDQSGRRKGGRRRYGPLDRRPDTAVGPSAELGPELRAHARKGRHPRDLVLGDLALLDDERSFPLFLRTIPTDGVVAHAICQLWANELGFGGCSSYPSTTRMGPPSAAPSRRAVVPKASK